MAFVLINHGWTNTRQVGHWQRKLAADLRRAGHQVFYPQYPDTANPSFEKWSQLLVAELELIGEAREGSAAELIIIGHSLGNVNLAKAVYLGLLPSNVKVDRLLLVAPPEPGELGALASFSLDISDPNVGLALKNYAGSVTLVGSDNDPWSPSGLQKAVGDPLGLEAIIIPGAKHMSGGDGWASWQGVFNWVNDPNANLTER